MITNRKYRYISPTFRFLKDSGKVVMLKGAGLVHSPALHLTTLAEEVTEADEPTIAVRIVAETLGLPPDASEADILDLLQRLRLMFGKVTGATDAAAQLAELGNIAEEERQIRFAEGKPDSARFASTETLQTVLTERNEALADLATLPRRIPLAKPWLTAYLYSQGLSIAQIARKLRISDVTVRNYLRREAANRERRQADAERIQQSRITRPNRL
ncbi:MAG: phage protease [Paracoccus sp. (in: a-proteobacteria)]